MICPVCSTLVTLPSEVDSHLSRYLSSIHQYQTCCCLDEYILPYLLSVSESGHFYFLVGVLIVAFALGLEWDIIAVRTNFFATCLLFLIRYIECQSPSLFPIGLFMVCNYNLCYALTAS
jgi:hypothetical protein